MNCPRCDHQPSCCASSRCSPPQRRVLQRRATPFSDRREAAPLLLPRSSRYPTPPPGRRADIYGISPPSLHPRPKRDSFSWPLCSPAAPRFPRRAPPRDSFCGESSGCSQKTLHANRRWRDVWRRGGAKRRWVVPAPRSLPVGKK